jgi:hypothetical protein
MIQASDRIDLTTKTIESGDVLEPLQDELFGSVRTLFGDQIDVSLATWSS